MAKRRRYGDAWKDVQIDAEQNDAVFDRFFRRTPPEEPAAPAAEKGAESSSPRRNLTTATPRAGKQAQSTARVSTLPHVATTADALAQIDQIKRQYRLSKGEAAVLRYLLERAGENGAAECYAKIPPLADACGMTHRGCQFALRSLEARGFITRLKDYDPTDRLGTRFRISLPAV